MPSLSAFRRYAAREWRIYRDRLGILGALTRPSEDAKGMEVRYSDRDDALYGTWNPSLREEAPAVPRVAAIAVIGAEASIRLQLTWTTTIGRARLTAVATDEAGTKWIEVCADRSAKELSNYRFQIVEGHPNPLTLHLCIYHGVNILKGEVQIGSVDVDLRKPTPRASIPTTPQRRAERRKRD